MPYEPTEALLVIETAIGNGISQRQLCEFTICDEFPSGISAPTISRVINGTKQLSYPEFRRLSAVVDATSEIIRRSPAPVNWGDVRRIRLLIEKVIAEKRNPPAPLTPAESNLLKRFAAGESMSDLCFTEKLSHQDLLARIGDLLDRTRVRTAVELQSSL